MKYDILTGDVVEVLPTLEANSFDAALCDPPYGLEFMGKEWDSIGRNVGPGGKRRGREVAIESRGGKWQPGSVYGVPAKNPRCMDCGRLRFDHADRKCSCAAPMFHARASEYGVAILEWHQFWALALFRVLKPGAMLVAFGGTRTHHRLMCALEDAGFEIRDCLMWLHGVGFPKSLDISKAIDKAAGAEREVVGFRKRRANSDSSRAMNASAAEVEPLSIPATDLARRWSGYGTALKPAFEPCIVAMKPLDGTFAHNAGKWGVAGINVDGSRIGWAGPEDAAAAAAVGYSKSMDAGRVHAPTSLPSTYKKPPYEPDKMSGRWPANVLLDEDAARQLDQMSGESRDGVAVKRNGVTANGSVNLGGIGRYPVGTPDVTYGGGGGASRFFYTAKVSTAEREGSDHPTMKPIDLTRYLAKLILPPQRETPRRIIVPFAGVGSEMIGAILAGWDEVIGIEKDEKYAAKARERIVGTAPLFLQEAK